MVAALVLDLRRGYAVVDGVPGAAFQRLRGTGPHAQCVVAGRAACKPGLDALAEAGRFPGRPRQPTLNSRTSSRRRTCVSKAMTGRRRLPWRSICSMAGTGGGVPIQADLHETYRRIRANGDGYCGDFADVYTGLLNAAGVFSRNWAFSFDGYGGRGHIVNEVWIRGADQWVLLDVFNNIYFVDAKGRPMSALAVRQALLDGQRPTIVGIEASASPGFQTPAQGLRVLRAGPARVVSVVGQCGLCLRLECLRQGGFGHASRRRATGRCRRRGSSDDTRAATMK